MQSEIRTEFREANTSSEKKSGFGFGFVEELKEKCLSVKRKILRKHDYIQTPEITKEVNEVLLLAETHDPDFRGSRRKRANYSLLLEYRHCWTRYDRMEDCPLSEDSLFMLNTLSSLRNKYAYEEQVIPRIDEFFKDFFINKFFALIKQAKKQGLTPHPELNARLPQARKNPTLITGILYEWLGKCPVCNYVVNIAVETLLKNRVSFNHYIEGKSKISDHTFFYYLEYIIDSYERVKESQELDKIPDNINFLSPISQLLQSLSIDDLISKYFSPPPQPA